MVWLPRPKTEARNNAGAKNGHPGHLVSVESAKDGGCVTFNGQRVEQTRSCKKGVVASGQDAGHDDGIDDAARGMRARHLADNGEWRRGCASI